MLITKPYRNEGLGEVRWSWNLPRVQELFQLAAKPQHSDPRGAVQNILQPYSDISPERNADPCVSTCSHLILRFRALQHRPPWPYF